MSILFYMINNIKNAIVHRIIRWSSRFLLDDYIFFLLPGAVGLMGYHLCDYKAWSHNHQDCGYDSTMHNTQVCGYDGISYTCLYMSYGTVDFKKGRFSLVDLIQLMNPSEGLGYFWRKSKHGEDLMQGIIFIAGWKDLRSHVTKNAKGL